MNKEVDQQVKKEWEKAKIEVNGYTDNDITKFLSQLLSQNNNYLEAKKILISAIRLVKKQGEVTNKRMTSGYVKNYVDTWIANKLITVDQVAKFEKEKLLQNSGERRKTGLIKPTSDEIQQQNERWAKELGYESVEAKAARVDDDQSSEEVMLAKIMDALEVGNLNDKEETES
ncbi:hypothetical protein [Weissella paramesenteroides]|uniref:hypothetical protein n=1 Tax=Weissella paramesenteroides TaxID=1249 RepID=UPI0023F9AECC|nr:hypothetical protein [Weissella paramesenteroides]MDF8372534.1 hypothetical protein [Weissella paramesenteroides]WIG66313.1 hypothetical protein G9U56_04835 [Weissella paramesenteroides]